MMIVAMAAPRGIITGSPFIAEREENENDPAAVFGEVVIDAIKRAAAKGFKPGPENPNYVVVVSFREGD